MSDPYYITTAISYPNGRPHIGHAYEAIATDVMARFQRARGREVRLITGTDASRMTAGVVSKAGNALLDKARLFDRGGVLPPGLTLARNDTGRDEHILTDEQLSAVASGRPVTVTVTADHAGFRDLIRAEIADDRARRG